MKEYAVHGHEIEQDGHDHETGQGVHGTDQGGHGHMTGGKSIIHEVTTNGVDEHETKGTRRNNVLIIRFM